MACFPRAQHPALSLSPSLPSPLSLSLPFTLLPASASERASWTASWFASLKHPSLLLFITPFCGCWPLFTLCLPPSPLSPVTPVHHLARPCSVQARGLRGQHQGAGGRGMPDIRIPGGQWSELVEVLRGACDIWMLVQAPGGRRLPGGQWGRLSAALQCLLRRKKHLKRPKAVRLPGDQWWELTLEVLVALTRLYQCLNVCGFLEVSGEGFLLPCGDWRSRQA